MNLADLWFVIIAIFWTGFFVLEGFDFGVGALHIRVGRTEDERRVTLGTIGPFWDGNEVWLVVGGAAIFAAFPPWYATWLSAAYLAVILLLFSLIIRGVSIEWRSHGTTDRSRAWGSTGLIVASILAPLLLGIALGDLLAGLPIDAKGVFTGSFWSLFTGFGVWTGITMLILCLLQGATFLALRTSEILRDRARRWAWRMGLAGLIAVIVYAVWIVLMTKPGPIAWAVLSLAVLGAIGSLFGLRAERDGLAFTGSSVAIGASVAAIFASLYPTLLISSTDTANSITVADSSGQYALTVMSVVALVFFPIVLLYQGYSYVVFRRRIKGPSSRSSRVAA